MSKSKIALAVALIAAAGSAGAAELLVTAQSAKGANAIAVDFVNDAKAAAFQARLQIPGAEKGNTDLSRCLSGLPKAFQGSCAVTKSGEVTLIVFSAGGGTLPDGQVADIGIRGDRIAAVGDLKGAEAGRVIELRGADLTLGRGPADVELADASLAPRHLRFTRAHGQITCHELARVDAVARVLVDGDVVELGDQRAIFKTVADVADV